ncbi:MAG: family transcriptional regulator, cyclic receptor protein [Thermoleophilaceae bacterium]|nr:family transcriptional regulator, cyclic receptor protein [Thermoleophilaceae bacterium]
MTHPSVARQEGTIRILEADPELGLRVPAAQIENARVELVAPVKTLSVGHWEVPQARSRLGFLMLEGLLARDLLLAGHTCTELLGEGDVLQPWVMPSEDRFVRYHVLWHVLEPVRLAILDEPLARSLAWWPQVMSALLERAMRRTMRMSVHQALLQLSPVETRLLVLFWHLAERWGHVAPNGIVVRLRMSHELLGQLVGSKRASVTTALGHITESGQIERRDDGTWLLRGSPPDELAGIHWNYGTGVSAPAI